MTNNEKQLLNNLLDALDSLYDGKLRVGDLWALLFATSEALRTTPHYNELLGPISDLLDIARSGANKEEMRGRALESTDRLRCYLADLVD